MKVAVGADHAGFPLKDRMIDTIRAAGHEIVDCGAHDLVPGDDYPDYAEAVAQAIRKGQAERGVLICGSGVGAPSGSPGSSLRSRKGRCYCRIPPRSCRNW